MKIKSYFKQCGPSQKCGKNFKIIKLSDRQQQYIVDIHNYYRNYVAMGKELRGNQPSAANMKMMVSFLLF